MKAKTIVEWATSFIKISSSILTCQKAKGGGGKGDFCTFLDTLRVEKSLEVILCMTTKSSIREFQLSHDNIVQMLSIVFIYKNISHSASMSLLGWIYW